MKLLYITNTKIPSKKANTYQSFQMASAFNDEIDDFEFLVANRHNDEFKIEDFINLVKPILKSKNINKILTISDFHFYKEFIKKYGTIMDLDVDEIIKKYIDDLILR